MNPLALITIGILAGLLLTVNLLSIVALIYISYRQRSELISSQAATRRALATSTVAIDRMRSEVALALSSMDADKLHDSAISIQSGVKSFQNVINQLGKMVFAAGAGETMGMAPQQAAQYDPNYDPNVYEWPTNPMRAPVMYADQQSHSHSPSAGTGTASLITDHFDQWRVKAVQEEAARLGYDTPLPPANLPDIQREDGSPLMDEDLATAHLDEYTPRTNQGQLRQFDDLPGNTEVGEGTGV